MSNKVIELKIGQVVVGSVVFEDSPRELHISRTATNINLTIPATVDLKWDDGVKPRPLLTNLQIVVSMTDVSSGEVELGRVRDDSIYYGILNSAQIHPQKTALIWLDALPAIVFIEKCRAAKRPRLHIRVHGELCYIVNVMGVPPKEIILTNPLIYPTRTPPQRFSHEFDLLYPEEIWSQMVQKAF